MDSYHLSPPNHNTPPTRAPLQAVDCMQGGTGSDSYAANSTLQNYTFHAYAKPHLVEAIDALLRRSQAAARTLRLADFGCSSGRNTIDYADFIVDQVRKRCSFSPEVQYFFSDLPFNDFNTLFQSLARDGNDKPDKGLQRVYVAGVPGSFYNQLFPSSTLDFAICTCALHWLSEVPHSVLDNKSPAWNGGHIHLEYRNRPKVSDSYAEHFKSDAKSFLKCRAHELKEGGILFVFALCRTEEKPTGSYFRYADLWNSHFKSTWDEMVSEGVVEAEERDLFNIPQYNFHRSELEVALKDVPELQLLKLEVIEEAPVFPEDEIQQLLKDPNRFGGFWARFLKSLTQPMVEKHIGKDRASEFFKRLQRIATENAHLTTNFALDLLIAIFRRT